MLSLKGLQAAVGLDIWGGSLAQENEDNVNLGLQAEADRLTGLAGNVDR